MAQRSPSLGSTQCRRDNGQRLHTQTAASPRSARQPNGKPTSRSTVRSGVQNNPGSYLTGTAADRRSSLSDPANSESASHLVVAQLPARTERRSWRRCLSRSPGTEFPSAYRNGQMARGHIANENTWLIDGHSIFDGTNHTMYVNNVAQTPVASTGAFSFDRSAPVPDDAGGTHLIGEVAEVVVYTQALSSTDRASLYSYLTRVERCWGTTLLQQQGPRRGTFLVTAGGTLPQPSARSTAPAMSSASPATGRQASSTGARSPSSPATQAPGAVVVTITGVGGGNTFLGLHAYPDGGVACYWETPTPDYVTYPFLPSDGWCLLVLTKAAGSAPMNFRRIRLSDGNTSTATRVAKERQPLGLRVAVRDGHVWLVQW